MLSATILLFALAVSHGAVLQPVVRDVTRIVGGEAADITEAPWQAAMLLDWNMNGFYGYSHGGVIIRADAVLTSGTAGNVTIPIQYRVRAGSGVPNSGGQVVDVSHIIVHPNYSSNKDYDLAVFLLETPLMLDGIIVAAALLPSPGQLFPEGAMALSTGYGTTSTGGNPLGRLTKIMMPLVSSKNCIELLAPSNVTITPRMLCAGVYGGPCHTDGGGPLTLDGVLLGVSSFTVQCGTGGLPSVWANIANLRNWIDAQLPLLN